MRVAGHFKYAQSPETVYQTFLDHDALLYATPGLRTLTAVTPDVYDATLAIGIGGFELVYQGRMTLTERMPNRQYRFMVDATTHNGWGRADALFQFLPGDAGGTLVQYAADVELGGGQKLLPSLARGLVDFFLRGMNHWMKEAAAGRRPDQY